MSCGLIHPPVMVSHLSRVAALRCVCLGGPWPVAAHRPALSWPPPLGRKIGKLALSCRQVQSQEGQPEAEDQDGEVCSVQSPLPGRPPFGNLCWVTLWRTDLRKVRTSPKLGFLDYSMRAIAPTSMVLKVGSPDRNSSIVWALRCPPRTL